MKHDNDSNEFENSFELNYEKNSNEIKEKTNIIKEEKNENVNENNILLKNKLIQNNIKNEIKNKREQILIQSKSYSILPKILNEKNYEKIKFERIQSSKIPNTTRNEIELYNLSNKNIQESNFQSNDDLKIT